MSFLDDILGGGSESTSRTFLDENQLPYLQDIWGNAQSLYNSGQSPVASLSPEMQSYIQSAMGFGNTAAGYGNQSASMAGGFGGTATGASDYLNQVMQGGGFQAPMQSGINMDTVSSLVDNDLLNSQIAASTRDVYRDLNENQLPGIASSSVGSGNTGSTRRGVAEAIAMRGADDRASDIAAGIRSNAYDRAVGVAANQAGANQQAQLGTNQLNASTAGSTLGTAGNLFNTGLGNAYNFGAGGVGVMGQGANAMQNYMQNLAMAPWQQLQLYQSAIGNPINQSESTQTQSGSPLGAIGGVLSGLGTGGLGWAPFAS